MDKNIKKGIQLLEEHIGQGRAAQKGDSVVYNIRAYLNKGDEVLINDARDRERWPDNAFTKENDYEYINFQCILGRRQAVAAVEYALYGMKKGGYRKIKASPHLAYGKEGIPGKIPENAVIIFEIWIRDLFEYKKY